MANYYYPPTQDELLHFGVKGMKWGVRRYQNKDGSLTPKGRQKYSETNQKTSKSKFKLTDKQKKIAKGVAIAAVTAGAAYAGYKGYKYLDRKATRGIRKEQLDEAIRNYSDAASKRRMLRNMLDEQKRVKLNDIGALKDASRLHDRYAKAADYAQFNKKQMEKMQKGIFEDKLTTKQKADYLIKVAKSRAKK